MFFRWYSENRHFKKESGLKGQVAPFLLVIIVILLVAAITTVNIGRVAIDKTYTGNAADAGALGAASDMAGTFNSLALANDGLRQSYDEFYEGTMFPLFNKAEDYWLNSVLFAAGAAALVVIATAYAVSLEIRPVCNITFPWEYLLEAFLAVAAAVLMYYAAEYTGYFNLTVGMIISYLDSWQPQQLEYYCTTIREGIGDAGRDAAEKTGYQLAFSNSGISDKLSDEQGNNYSEFMDTEDYASGEYSWDDKIGGSHRVLVNVSVPAINNYILQHTVDPYSVISEHLEKVYDDSSTVQSIETTMAIILGVAALTWTSTAVFSIIWWAFWICSQTVIGCIACCWYIAPGCVIVKWLEGLSTVYTTWVGGVLGALLTIGALWGGVNIYLLRDDLNEAWNGMGPGGTQGSTGCSDASDLLIVQIASVPYPGDVSVSSSQIHPGTSSAIVPTSYPTISSSATASYLGGDVGSFDDSYDSELTSAN